MGNLKSAVYRDRTPPGKSWKVLDFYLKIPGPGKSWKKYP